MSKPPRKHVTKKRTATVRRVRARKGDTAALMHELEVHRVELEAQNEALAEAQHKLEESRDMYSDLFDFAPVAYVTLDAKGVIRNLNLVAATLIGIGRQHAINVPFASLVHPEHQARFWAHLARCRRDALALMTDLDLRLRGRPERLPVQIVTGPPALATETGEYRTAILELSDRKLAEDRRIELVREAVRREEAELASRAKDEFFSLLAHELRTPLNAVHGWTHLLASKQLPPHEVDHAIEVIERNVNAQVSIINDMLDISRIIRGALDLRIRGMDLSEVLQSAIDAIRPSADQNGVTIESQVDPIATTIEGDPDRLFQVISNVLSNAIKFTPRGGHVTIRLERGIWTSTSREDHRDCARLVVRDSGWGIPLDDLEHIFEPFRKGRHASKRNVSGLGLGLAIVRKLVEMHGGSIWARSDGPGNGSEFIIELPIGHDMPNRLTMPSEPLPANGGARLDGVSVLAVDDDPEARELIRRLLEPLGASVTTVPSAQDAYRVLRSSGPDILVSDIAMPEEDGISLIHRVRALPVEEGGQTPAIALTAYAGAGDEDRVVAAGFQTFVAKPVDPGQLAGLIGNLTDLSSRRPPVKR